MFLHVFPTNFQHFRILLKIVVTASGSANRHVENLGTAGQRAEAYANSCAHVCLSGGVHEPLYRSGALESEPDILSSASCRVWYFDELGGA